VGNRATEASFWAVLCATEAAFPLLLGASVDRARQAAATVGAEGNCDFVRDLWILQVETGAPVKGRGFSHWVECDIGRACTGLLYWLMRWGSTQCKMPEAILGVHWHGNG